MLFKTKEETTSGSSIKRIKNMETPNLKNWFDTTLWGLGAAYDQWRFHDGSDKEVSEHIHVLDEIWKELQVRNDHAK